MTSTLTTSFSLFVLLPPAPASESSMGELAQIHLKVDESAPPSAPASADATPAPASPPAEADITTGLVVPVGTLPPQVGARAPLPIEFRHSDPQHQQQKRLFGAARTPEMPQTRNVSTTQTSHHSWVTRLSTCILPCISRDVCASIRPLPVPYPILVLPAPLAVAQYRLRHQLLSHLDGVRTLAFHPTLPLLLSGSEDATLKVWNLKNMLPQSGKPSVRGGWRDGKKGEEKAARVDPREAEVYDGGEGGGRGWLPTETRRDTAVGHVAELGHWA